jgi:nucleolin
MAIEEKLAAIKKAEEEEINIQNNEINQLNQHNKNNKSEKKEHHHHHHSHKKTIAEVYAEKFQKRDKAEDEQFEAKSDPVVDIEEQRAVKSKMEGHHKHHKKSHEKQKE